MSRQALLGTSVLGSLNSIPTANAQDEAWWQTQATQLELLEEQEREQHKAACKCLQRLRSVINER